MTRPVHRRVGTGRTDIPDIARAEGGPMDVLAINGSPRGDRGVTARILAPFLEGMREASARTEVLLARDLDVNPCKGCRRCWTRTRGVCVQDDDMREVYPKMRAADVLVLGTPVYLDGMTGPLKTVLDRGVALLHPRIEVREGRMRHPMRDRKEGRRQVALVSVCGFWEAATFGPLVSHVKAAAKNMDREWAGAVLRPHGWVLAGMGESDPARVSVLAAVREAGRQLAAEGRMRPETLRAAARPLVSRRRYMDLHDEWVETME